MDNRRTERRSLNLEVEEISGYPEGKSIIIDYSPLGAKLETDFPMSDKEMVRISLRLKDGDDLLILPGQVLWIKKISSEPQRYRVGIRFTNPLFCRY
jgi:Tfp pilus assembly protein PilZ